MEDKWINICGKRFHFIWLRDNCLCNQCRHPTSFQKIYDISECIAPPRPIAITETDNHLIINWQETPAHRSIFPLSWLIDNAYDPQPQPLLAPDILWDRATIKQYQLPSYDIHNCEPETWMEQVATLGFALVKNVALGDLEPLISAIGPVHEFECGRFDTVKASESGRDVTYASSKPLLLHTDASHRYDPRLIEFLLFVENKATGGETVLVDGFKVAEDFRLHHPDYFQILAQTPVQFRHYEVVSRYFFCRTTSILELDAQDQVAAIYFSHKNCNRHLPFDKIEDYYAAYSTFFRYLKDPTYQYCFRLEAEDCLVMKNFRILHGRTPYDAGSGARHLKVGYVGWHYFMGRINFQRYKHLYMGFS